MLKHPRLPFLKASVISLTVCGLLIWQTILIVQQQLMVGLPLLIAGTTGLLFFIGFGRLTSPIGSYAGTLGSFSILTIVCELIFALIRYLELQNQMPSTDSLVLLLVETGFLLLISGALSLYMFLLFLSSVIHFRQKDLV